ncbi:restriction endonuclease subunit S [Campylobacter ureolyticus]|uniref:restriction endonuclease subunit S n=1 Tax=Campylobacter ureolyticus TaxID=827 RepID=UPI0022B51370|nr:restriction endonuclease subunit S [Campylobacter ureolyticus]MCZ6168570.1 restriction endonuclease subunit S [Campylobacter ureolyticus]
MALTKYNLGELLELTTETNSELKYGPDDVKGMTITKEIIPTKANVKDTDLKKFLVVHPKEFIFNPRTHGKKIGFGYNSTGETFLISWNNIAFRIKKDAEKSVLPEYLFLHFNRSEWDREACYRSWGSSTEVFSWYALCEMVLDLPPIDIQQKYVDIYNAMVSNQEAYEEGLEDLKLACDGTIENIKAKYPKEKIMPYINREDNRNSDNMIKNVKGVSTSKEFREPTSKVNRDKLSNYKIVKPKEISFVQTTHNEKVFAYAFNNTDKDIVVTSVNEVFSTSKDLLPEYLVMFFNRKEFDRYARFHSWGSARETFTWEDLENVEIPIISIKLQKYISDIYKVYTERKEINEKLKEQIKSICPVLIKGAMEEASREGV